MTSKDLVGSGVTMQRILQFVMSNWGNEMAVRWISNIMVAVQLSLGISIMVGGIYRFPYPTYQPLIDMVNGHIWIWGTWSILAAGLMMVPTRWPSILGLWLSMFWQIMWCVAFAIAVVLYPTSGATAAIAYGGFALINAALLTARIVDRDGG